MRFSVLSILCLLTAVPSTAQGRTDRVQNDDGIDRQQPQQQQLPIDEQIGRTGDTGSGEVGQRQTRAQAAPNIAPLGRVQARVANRVQNRIRNRIDRYYDPQANAISPFRVAEEVTRTTSTPR